MQHSTQGGLVMQSVEVVAWYNKYDDFYTQLSCQGKLRKIAYLLYSFSNLKTTKIQIIDKKKKTKYTSADNILLSYPW